jgi:hypothetical protein
MNPGDIAMIKSRATTSGKSVPLGMARLISCLIKAQDFWTVEFLPGQRLSGRTQAFVHPEDIMEERFKVVQGGIRSSKAVEGDPR